jgi:hypothetical protein
MTTAISNSPSNLLTEKDLFSIEEELGNNIYVEAERLREVGLLLEHSAIGYAVDASRRATLAASAAYLICKFRLYEYLKDERGEPFIKQGDFLRYLQRRSVMGRSSFYQYQASLRIWDRGLGRPLNQLPEFGAGVTDAHHLKKDVKYNHKTGEILGPAYPDVLDKLPPPPEGRDESDVVARLNVVVDDIIAEGEIGEYTITRQGVAKRFRQDIGGEPQISFYFCMGPFGNLALAWYYAPDGDNSEHVYRGLVGVDEMPQTVAAKLRERVRATEKDPEPYKYEPFCPECGSYLERIEWKNA